jgi:hypothetical protein
LHEEAISSHVIGFIADHISSVVQLEVLLLLHAQRDRRFTAEELAKELRVNPDWIVGQVQNLCDRGILTCNQSGVWTLQYQPRTSDLDNTVAELARTYEERRVSVITLIFNKPTDQVKSFADAFRIRKDGGNG